MVGVTEWMWFGFQLPLRGFQKGSKQEAAKNKQHALLEPTKNENGSGDRIIVWAPL